MIVWRLDAGTYESECIAFLGQGNRERLIIKCGDNDNITEVIKFEARYEDALCKKLSLETSLVYSVSLVSGTISDTHTLYFWCLENGSYTGSSTDIRIRTDNYDDFSSSNGIVCSPKLKKGKTYSFTEIDCTVGDESYSNQMLMFVGIPYTMTAKFGKDEKGVFVDQNDFQSDIRLYKVSDSTDESGGGNVALIIVVVVILIIAVIAGVAYFLIKKKSSPILTAV